jgi:acyl carrier protein
MSSPVLPSGQPLVPREQLLLPRPYVAPRTQAEQSLAEMWRTVLNMDSVGVEDDYYDLGGDSFHATIIFGMIEKTFRVRVPKAILADNPTIAELARKIDALSADVPNGRQ